MWYLSFPVWFISLTIKPSKSSMLLQMAKFHISMHIYHIFFIHSSVDGHLGCFYILLIISNAAVNVGYTYLFEFVFLFSLDRCPRVKLLGRMVILFLFFLRKLRTTYCSPCTNLHFPQQCTRVPFAPDPCNAPYFLCFWQ